MKLSMWIDAVALLLLIFLVNESQEAKGGRGRGKGKGKNLLPFGNVAEYSLVKQNQAHPKGAQIVKASHFNQIFRLGYKILLICMAKGTPRPDIKWYKDGSEIYPRPNTHIYEVRKNKRTIWSKIEIDPATLGDQGVFTCMANNRYGLMVKNFKTESTY